MSGWTFLSNHGHVMLVVAADPGVRLRDVAAQVGITERATQAIVRDLVDEGYLAVTKVGRRNLYEVDANRPLRHPAEQEHNIGQLIALLAGKAKPIGATGPGPS